MTSQEGANLRFLYAHHEEDFRALSDVTAYATDILDEPALADGATRSMIRADRQEQQALEAELFRQNVGPFAVRESVDYARYHDLGPVTAEITASQADMEAQKAYQPPLQGDPTSSELFDRNAIFGLTDSADALEEYVRDKHAPFRGIATGRHSHYYHAYARTQRQVGARIPSPQFQIRVPVGEYDANFSLQLLQTTYNTMGNADVGQQLSIEAFARPHAEILERHVTWVRNVKRDPNTPLPLGFALSKSVYEGDLSIQQSVSILTAEKVEGFDSGFELWAAIRKAKLVDQFTRLLPFGNLAPANLINAYIPGLVVPDEVKGVALNPEVVSELEAYKEATRAEMIKAIKAGKPIAHNEMGIFCPAAVKHGGLEQRHDLLFRRFVRIADPEAEKRGPSRWWRRRQQ